MYKIFQLSTILLDKHAFYNSDVKLLGTLNKQVKSKHHFQPTESCFKVRHFSTDLIKLKKSQVTFTFSSDLNLRCKPMLSTYTYTNSNTPSFLLTLIRLFSYFTTPKAPVTLEGNYMLQ